MLDARLMSKPRIRHCFQTYSHLRLSTFLVLSNCIYPSEQCRVESNCRKHKVLPQLKAASFEQMSFHMHIAGTSVMWSIFKAQHICQDSNLIKSIQFIVHLHIIPISSFLAKVLSLRKHKKDNIFARNEDIGKICTWTIT